MEIKGYLITIIPTSDDQYKIFYANKWFATGNFDYMRVCSEKLKIYHEIKYWFDNYQEINL